METSQYYKDLETADPGLFNLIKLEDERQARRLIMIPSESIAPKAVFDALGSSFTNVYAEGYPRPETRLFSEEEIFDYTGMLGTYRRYSDPRYYKGVEYVDVVEALARRRCAEAFANERFSADDLFVNVQPLSGAPANNAVYTALLTPGDTILGMSLLHGGHLTHGSSVNRSGLLYKAEHYTVDMQTEVLDYDAIYEKALATKPKIIIAGYSSYPWVPDWKKFREIADEVGAYLLTDISHIIGLIVANQIPSPVGYAHIITSTTHKTLLGPRGAVIITDKPALSRKIDQAVFPGEQGGPHINTIAAIAHIFKIAKTESYKKIQAQVIKNTVAFADQLKARGLRIPYGGTNTHLALLDCKSIHSDDGAYLTGDIGARILDAAGIVANSNTIPGDRSTFTATGIRFGTTILTQRCLKEDDLKKVADIIANLLESTTPYFMSGKNIRQLRAKVDFRALEEAKLAVETIADHSQCFIPHEQRHGYPHYFNINDNVDQEWASFRISGDQARLFLNYTLSCDIEDMKKGDTQKTRIHTTMGAVDGAVTCEAPDSFKLTVPGNQAGLASSWLRDLSDAYIQFDADLLMRVPGPMRIENAEATAPGMADNQPYTANKPYYIGMEKDERKGEALPLFSWVESEAGSLKKTVLNEIHRDLGAKMIPFAGWDMPVWYSSVLEEHTAVRQAAGLFDVTHMGVFQVEGPDASIFLDSVCGNDIGNLAVGKSIYTHFLDPDANVIDDLLVYRREDEKYLVVVNASNDEKDWAWLNAVRQGAVLVDKDSPWAVAFGRNVILRNLRDPQNGKDQLVDIAIQGPKSRDILLKLEATQKDQDAISALNWSQLCEVTLNNIEMVISRTGYTGERMGYELFVHPDHVVTLWQTLLRVGNEFGLKPCGLGARDSLRTEAGLPLYGHEMGGTRNMSVGQGGFDRFIKTYKPWFIGRTAFLDQEAKRTGTVVRFQFDDKRTRMAHPGDPVLDQKGKVIGAVTSCAINSEGSLTGQAFVLHKFTEEGTELFIYQGSPQDAGKAPANLTMGDRTTLPAPATVISRFLK